MKLIRIISRIISLQSLTGFLFFCFHSANADICKVVSSGVTYTPPQKYSVYPSSNHVITIYGQAVNYCSRVVFSGTGVDFSSKGSPVSNSVACNTSINIGFTVSSNAIPGECTATVYVTLPGLVSEIPAGTFKLDVKAPYCTTPEGQFSMMLPPVAVSPTVTAGASNSQYNLQFTSSLFNLPMSENDNLSCQNSIVMYVYHAASSALLDGLDQKAATDGAEELVTPAGVLRQNVTFTRAGNLLTCRGTFSRQSLPAGTRYYRIAKRISKSLAEDPYVFNPVLTFNVINKAPVAIAGPDQNVVGSLATITASGSTDDQDIASYLWTKISGGNVVMGSANGFSNALSGLSPGNYTFRLTVKDFDGASSVDDVNLSVTAGTPDLIVQGISQRLFGGGNGTVGDGTFTYLMLPQNFCTGLPGLSSFTQAGTLPSNITNASDKRIMKLDYSLPDMKIFIKNQGTAGTGAGFSVDMIKNGSATVLKTFTSPLLQAGTSGFVTFTGRGIAPVYRFPGLDTDDPRFCYVRQELNGSFPASYQLESNQIRIMADSKTVIPESSESNNSLNVDASTNPITVP